MRSDNFRTLAEYIHEVRRRNRNYHPTGKQPAFDTTTEDDSDWDQGHRSGDAGRGENSPG
jgi:hypothetical protein